LDKEIVMGLVRAALIFGAGYVLGRPEGRAKVAELANRPEVAQLRQQATGTVVSSVKSGKERLTEATASTNRRGRRLPSFPKRGARHAASTTTATAPTDAAATDTTLTNTGPASTGPTAQSKPARTASGELGAAPVPSTTSLPTNGPKT
jgi:hypothetical protein